MDADVVACTACDARERELAGVRAQLDQAQARIDELEAGTQRLAEDLDQAQKRLEGARRAGKRQAAPFSRDAKKPDPKRPGRKAGKDYGPRARRQVPAPDEIDEIIVVDLPGRCECGGEVAHDKTAHQYQEDFVPARRVVRRFDVKLGHCTSCDQRVRGRHRLQTSDALGAAGVMLGPAAHALAAWLHLGLGVSMRKVTDILGRLCGLEVTPGGLHTALHTTAKDAKQTFEVLLECLRDSEAVAADETGWRIDAERAWLWVYVGDRVCVYDIAAGRGYADAAAVLGGEFPGVLERDGWAPYRKFVEATHQTCLAHLLRRCQEMIEDAKAGQAKVPHDLRRILKRALAARDNRLEGEVLQKEVVALQAEIERFCARQPTYAPNRRLVTHITNEADHLLTFLTHDGVQATNWRAEQALRPMIVNRKSWGGNKTRRGADSAAVIASVMRTAQLNNLDPIDTLAQLRTTGTVPAELAAALAGPDP